LHKKLLAEKWKGLKKFGEVFATVDWETDLENGTEAREKAESIIKLEQCPK
jgi:hypothetical protein